jgi:hypothetical protein
MRFWQTLYFRRFDKDLNDTLSLVIGVGLLFFGVMVILPTFMWLRGLNQFPSLQMIVEMLSGLLFLWSILFFLLLLVASIRYVAERKWFVFKRKVIEHFESCDRVPPSHILLPDMLFADTLSLAATVYYAFYQVRLQRPPHLNLGRSSPFLLFQQATLLVAP